jgi:hypothetical protein
MPPKLTQAVLTSDVPDVHAQTLKIEALRSSSKKKKPRMNKRYKWRERKQKEKELASCAQQNERRQRRGFGETTSYPTLTLKPTVGTVFNVLPAMRRKKRVVFPAASRPTRSTLRWFLDL